MLPELTPALQNGGLTAAQETWALWTLARAGADDEFFTKAAADAAAPLNGRLQLLRILGFPKSAGLAAVLASALRDMEPRVRFAAVQAVHQAGWNDLLPALVAHTATETDRVTRFATWRAMRDLGGAAALMPLLKEERLGIRSAALLGLLDLIGRITRMCIPACGSALAPGSLQRSSKRKAPLPPPKHGDSPRHGATTRALLTGITPALPSCLIPRTSAPPGGTIATTESSSPTPTVAKRGV